MVTAYAFILPGLALVSPLSVAAESIGKPTFAWPVEGQVVDNEDGRKSPAASEGIDILVPPRARRSGRASPAR